MDAKRIAIVGGCGFVGQNLTLYLINKGYFVLILDFSPCLLSISNISNVTYNKVDILNTSDMERIISEFIPSTVIHLASWGMSGEGMLNPLCQSINVKGTSDLIDICFKYNISKFIYTSSYNVIFGGEVVNNGDETLPYYEESRQVDQYSSSKTRAEKIVLQANGKLTKNGKRFMSVSIRPAAIYGEGELRHLPRIVNHMDNGLFLMKIGNATVDWVHVENLVQAFSLVINQMHNTEDTESVPAGQTYFISDGTPVNNFDFLKPLCEARGRKYPSLIVPTNLMLTISYIMEKIYFLGLALHLPFKLVPILTRAEVLKVGVTHYFSIDKARRELGYDPKITSTEGAQRIANYYAERLNNADFFEIVHIGLYIAIFAGMILLAMTAFCSDAYLHSNVFISSINWLALKIFQTQTILKYVFTAACGAHIFESLIAYKLSIKMGCINTKYIWWLQTLFLGYPSLKILYDRRNLVNN